LAAEVNRITYAAQTEGVSEGRLPNGTGAITSFPGSASPGASNYVNIYTGPYLNEVLARNVGAVTNSAGRASDFIELFNPGTGAFDLSGMSLSVDAPEPGQWVFPAGTMIAGQGLLVVWCDSDLAASLTTGPFLNTGRSIDGESGAAYLFDTARHLADAIEFGPQLDNLSIGRVGSEWRLVGAITPGSANAGAATLGTASALRINEWMASGTGDDWFEIHNPTSLPMGLSGLYLSDDLSQSGATRHPVAPLSFIGPGQWVKFIADGRPDAGRNHVNFSLNGEGESIRLYSGILAPIDTVSFGRQLFNVSEGRWPDGGTNVAAFPGSASPGAANYRLIENVVINEVLAANVAPLEAAIELHNPTAVPVNLGGWFLSDSATNFLKFRIPDGTTMPAGGFAVFYENAFNSGSPGSFSLSIARGGELWLSATDTAGAPTGYRVGAEFGPSLDGISHGRVSTSHGVEFVALGQRTFGVDAPSTVQEFRQGTGLANAGAAVGPVVINEIMYHPSVGTNSSSDDEYIELHNPTASAVPLYDPAHPANHWRLADAVEFTFAPGASIPSGGYLLVVSFDPMADPISLANFRARYGLSAAAPVVGPYRGRLDNAGENVELRRPGPPRVAPSPDAGLVPDVLADRVNYDDAAPWPSGLVAGGGLSVQRRQPLLYGNEPTNWLASTPTPGAANGAGIVPPPIIAQSPAAQSVLADSPVALQVVASGAGPLAYQWRCNGRNIDTATNATLTLRFVQPEQSGLYDAMVSNPGGAVISQAASLLVRAIPEILLPPINQAVRINQGTTLSVLAKGSAPLAYHWRFNGTPIPGETNASLVLTNLQLEGEGTYEVEVSNTVGQTRASANIVVLEVVAFVVEPLSQSVVEGGDFSVSAAVSGNPAPYSFSWRRVTAPAGIFSYVDSPSKTNLMTFNTAAIGFVLASNETALAVNCRLVISNAATSPPGFQSRFTITVLRDSDLDGLPDTWENAYEPTPGAGVTPAIDHDGDGMTNGEEYTAGTDPNNPLSLLEVSLEESLGMPAVIFRASSNKTYTVEFTDHVSNGPWAKLGDVVAQSADRVETMIDPDWNEKRFYRVVTPHRPRETPVRTPPAPLK
jgi:hypothetical protein